MKRNMGKKIRYVTFLALLFVTLSLSKGSYAENNFTTHNLWVNGNNVEIRVFDGYLEVHNANAVDKISVTFLENSKKMQYDCLSQTEIIPLQLGNGTYKVNLLEKVQNKKGVLRVITSFTFTGKSLEENKQYLISAQPVYWGEFEKNLSNQILDGTENLSESEKLEKIYNFVTRSVRYDYKKNNFYKNNPYESYYPNNKETLVKRKGICYDYASLIAGLLRSQSIPTKLVKGYRENSGYHAWIEVLVNDEWKILDPTWNQTFKFLSPNLFTATNVY